MIKVRGRKKGRRGVIKSVEDNKGENDKVTGKKEGSRR